MAKKKELKRRIEELEREVDRLRARVLDLECAPSIPLPIGVPFPIPSPYTIPYPRDPINWPPITISGTDTKGWQLIYGPADDRTAK